MKKFIILTACVTCALAAHSQGQKITELNYWFDTPNTLQGKAIWEGNRPQDADWESQSLPIGNGSIGANILGSIEAERITFNEKTLWRGGPNTEQGADAYWNVNKQSAHLLPEIRQAFTDGNLDKVDLLTRKNFNSEVPYEAREEKAFRFGNFTTMGEFYIETGLSTIGMEQYRRALSLDSAMVNVQFKKDQVNYSRSYFISYPNQIMVVRYRADKPGQQNLTFSYAPNPEAEGEIEAIGKNELVYRGKLKNNQMNFAVRIRAIHRGGTSNNLNNKLQITQADEVMFLITADTDYRINFHPDFKDPRTYVGEEPMKTTEAWMEKAAAMTYEELLEAHYRDYSRLFKRVQLHLNPEVPVADLPINKRLENYRQGKPDYYLEQLYYQFGRYLLIASSRPGNLPANLQGIWHNNVDGPWRVDYHNNINLQMNYWPACSTNLDECMLPLIDFIRTLVKPGEQTARAYFGARGWTASISGNIFGFTAPLSSEDMSWNFNPMAGPWLATHVWEYYDYTRNKQFLKDIGYELIKSSAQFAVDYLWHKPDGTYTAAPSTSPEHGPIDQGATFVHAVIREILHNAIDASKVLKVDTQERKQWQEVLQKLAPYRIGRYGQLLEWSTDIDDPKDEHRHVNHLFGLHPGHTISPITTPELAQASKVVLNHRGDGATGWSMGWKLNQWARLMDGNHAYLLFKNLLKNGTLDNLWDTHPPFQIDGNFGGTAGITEMLLQSHMGFIQLLPALPDSWQEGSVKGLRTRGNFEIDMEWKGGVLQKATVTSHAGVFCQIRYNDQLISFPTQEGKRYAVSVSNGRLMKKAL